MSEWKEYRIEETSIEIIDGDRGQNYPKSNEFFAEGYCLFLNAGNVTKNGFSFSDNSFITREKDNVLRKGRLERSDVVITTRGTVGNIAIYDINVPFEHIRINSGMLILKSGKDILPEYLYYYLKGNRFQTQIRQYVSGTAQPQLPKSTLEKMSISYPHDKSIQEKIIAILNFFENKIAVNRRICENLEAQAQALFKHWFIDFAPFKNGNFVESELGMIPEGWRVGTLGDLGKIICGKTPSKSNKSYYGDDVPFIKIPDMHGNVFILKSEDNLSIEGSNSQSSKLIPEFSIMVSCIATVGLVAMNIKPSHTNQQINTIVPCQSCYRYYVYENLKLRYKELQVLGSSGTTTYNVNTRTFSSLKIIVPELWVIEDFNNVIKFHFEKILNLYQENLRLSTLRDTLLPKLMSGQIKV